MRLSEFKAAVDAIVVDSLNPDPQVVLVLQGVEYIPIEEVSSNKHGDPGSHSVCIIGDRTFNFEEFS